MPDDYGALAAFREEDISAILTRSLALATGKCDEQDSPRAILLAGQPGAGKTILSSMVVSQLGGNAFFINGDDYRRYHPNYKKLYSEFGSDAVKMTSPFSNAVVERLIEAFSDRRINLVVEGTGRDASVPERTAALLSAKGYCVELMAIAARPEHSLISTLLRFYQMNEGGTTPRATAISAHDLVVETLPGNLDTLCFSHSISQVTIWDRDLNQLYDSSTDTIMPSTVLCDYWDRPWSADELFNAQEQIAVLRQKERESNLGQGAAIDELAARIAIAEHMQDHAFDMTME